MRELLVGYVLNATEADERALVEQQLQSDPSLRRELELLKSSLDPLACDAGHCEPPAGIVQRCCEYVRQRAEVMPAALSKVSEPAAIAETGRPWSWLDYSVAGSIAAAVAVLLVPAIYQSRADSQLIACRNNLKDVGMALASYRDRHPKASPAAHPQITAAGMWAPTLVSEGYLPQDRSLVCPSSPLAEDKEFRIPRVEELENLKPEQLAVALPQLSGSYGFTLGHRDKDGKYHPPVQKGRSKFAVMADAPGEGPTNSPNHGGEGQNVLYEDCHVEYLKGCHDCEGQDIFRNDLGKVAPGTHADDSVIVPGYMKPE